MAITTTETTTGRLVMGTPFLSRGSLRRLRYKRCIRLFCVRSRRGRSNSEGKHPDGHSVRSADESSQSKVSYDRLTVSSRPLDEACMIAQILPVRLQPWSHAKSASFLEGGQDYCLALFVTFGPLRVLGNSAPRLKCPPKRPNRGDGGHTSPLPLTSSP